MRPTIGFTEALGASAQDLSDSGTVSFDDIDTNDVVDISTTLTTARRCGAAARSIRRWRRSWRRLHGQRDRRGSAGQHALELHGQRRQPGLPGGGETITLTYTVTATDSAGATHRHGDASPSPAPTMRRRSMRCGRHRLYRGVGASAQDLSDSGTVSFDDIDTNDVVDISTTLTNGGGVERRHDRSGAGGPAGGGFTASVTDAAAPGSTPWSYTVNDANLDFLAAARPSRSPTR